MLVTIYNIIMNKDSAATDLMRTICGKISEGKGVQLGAFDTELSKDISGAWNGYT